MGVPTFGRFRTQRFRAHHDVRQLKTDSSDVLSLPADMPLVAFKVLSVVQGPLVVRVRGKDPSATQSVGVKPFYYLHRIKIGTLLISMRNLHFQQLERGDTKGHESVREALNANSAMCSDCVTCRNSKLDIIMCRNSKVTII